MDNSSNNEENLKISVPKTDTQTIKLKKGFVEKNYESLKWSIGVYHIFFALWATYTLLQAVLPAINNLIFAIPITRGIDRSHNSPFTLMRGLGVKISFTIFVGR